MHLNPHRLDLLCAIAGRVTTGARPAPFQSITRVNNNYDDLVDHDAKKTMRQYAQLHTAKENSVEILKWLLICSQDLRSFVRKVPLNLTIITRSVTHSVGYGLFWTIFVLLLCQFIQSKSSSSTANPNKWKKYHSLRVFHRGSKPPHLLLGNNFHLLGHTRSIYSEVRVQRAKCNFEGRNNFFVPLSISSSSWRPPSPYGSYSFNSYSECRMKDTSRKKEF